MSKIAETTDMRTDNDRAASDGRAGAQEHPAGSVNRSGRLAEAPAERPDTSSWVTGQVLEQIPSYRDLCVRFTRSVRCGWLGSPRAPKLKVLVILGDAMRRKRDHVKAPAAVKLYCLTDRRITDVNVFYKVTKAVLDLLKDRGVMATRKICGLGK